jgi:DNA-binding transcriptional regulator YhcF (GntR family)
VPQRRFQHIVDNISGRIAAGQLRPGDRVPSARQITREWGVAMATATRALTVLGDKGLVSARPGVGTVVASRPTRVLREPRTRDEELTAQRIVAAAIAVADSEGIGAVSMRRVAIDLGVPTMALYRHVRGKNNLLVLMADAVLGEALLPTRRPAGWQEQLALVARLQWSLYREHPWMVRVISLTRPGLMPNGMAHTEWALRAVDGLGLDTNTMLHVAVALFGFVRGSAMTLDMQAEAEQETGLTDEQWIDSQDAAFNRLFASGRYPTIKLVTTAPVDLTPQSLFEFGLKRLLDGYAALFEAARTAS